jgi:hypothetical protein
MVSDGLIIDVNHPGLQLVRHAHTFDVYFRVSQDGHKKACVRAINYFGKRGSFMQYCGANRLSALDEPATPHRAKSSRLTISARVQPSML